MVANECTGEGSDSETNGRERPPGLRREGYSCEIRRAGQLYEGLTSLRPSRGRAVLGRQDNGLIMSESVVAASRATSRPVGSTCK